MYSLKLPFPRAAYLGMSHSNPLASGRDLLPVSKRVVSWQSPVISWDHALLRTVPGQWLSKMVVQRQSHFYPTQGSPREQSLLWTCSRAGRDFVKSASRNAGSPCPIQRPALFTGIIPLSLFHSSLSPHLLPEEHNRQHPASFVALGCHTTQFWPVRCKQKLQAGSLEKHWKQKQSQLRCTFWSSHFPFFLPGIQMCFEGWEVKNTRSKTTYWGWQGGNLKQPGSWKELWRDHTSLGLCTFLILCRK